MLLPLWFMRRGPPSFLWQWQMGRCIMRFPDIPTSAFKITIDDASAVTHHTLAAATGFSDTVAVASGAIVAAGSQLPLQDAPGAQAHVRVIEGVVGVRGRRRSGVGAGCSGKFGGDLQRRGR